MELINKFVAGLVSRFRDEREEGQTMVEYGLIIALISIAAIVTLAIVGDELVAVFQDVVDALQGT